VPNKEKNEITNALKHKKGLIETLQKYEIKHILLAKEDDYKHYYYLDMVPGVHLVHEDSKLKLYNIGGAK